MEKDYLIAIIGPKDAISGFKALGLIPINALNSEEALEKIKELKKEKSENDQKESSSKYAIIFIMEELAENIPEDAWKKIKKDVLPAIVPIPSSKGTSGYGIKRIGKMIEQAVGSDIFGDDK